MEEVLRMGNVEIAKMVTIVTVYSNHADKSRKQGKQVTKPGVRK